MRAYSDHVDQWSVCFGPPRMPSQQEKMLFLCYCDETSPEDDQYKILTSHMPSYSAFKLFIGQANMQF